MKFWLTTHWPHPANKAWNAPHYGVWLPDGKIQAGDGLEAGDLVLVYETQSGKSVLERYPDGSTKAVPRRDGRQGIVGLLRVLDRPTQPADSRPDVYTDGTSTWWRYVAATESLNSTGFVARIEVLRVLGLAEGYYFRGFGKLNSGLGEISASQFAELCQLLEGSAEARIDEIQSELAAVPRTAVGEGALHKSLKIAIANDPSRMLNEEGLRLWQMEYVLPTNDRIDVVLVDRFGRFVVVEVEPRCEASEIVGPLQCVKYRALMSFLFGHPLQEVRAFLVSPSIHSDVRQKCSPHGIQCLEVSIDAPAA